MGRMKHLLESLVEQKCTCDGGCCLDKAEHECTCPAVPIIEEVVPHGKS